MKFEKTKVFNFDGAIRGMRNPYDSWDKSDSKWILNEKDSNEYFVIGEKDKELAVSLIKGGSEHRKFLRQIFVCVDISAPLYWWKEFVTYRVGVISNSCSTMHTITKYEFTPEMFECKHLRGYRNIIDQTPNKIDPETENWKYYPYNKQYLVSDQGRIKRLSYKNENNNITYKEKIIYGSIHDDGYVFISIPTDKPGKYKQIPKHIMIADTWLNHKKFDGAVIDHIDGNKQNNNILNLEYVTQSENIKRSIKNNQQPIPIKGYVGKLTKEERNKIIEEYMTTDISRNELSKKYNVSKTTISSIINHKYDYGEHRFDEYQLLLNIIDDLNELREEYLQTKDKKVWKSLITLLPDSFIQKRTITMTYENLLAMCSKGQRRFHKLTEWSTDFINWARSLPYAQEFIFTDELNKNEE